MSEPRPEFGETPNVEVRVFRNGELIQTELCESADEAAALVATWEERRGVECEVVDLSATVHDDASFEVSEADGDREYPHTS